MSVRVSVRANLLVNPQRRSGAAGALTLLKTNERRGGDDAFKVTALKCLGKSSAELKGCSGVKAEERAHAHARRRASVYL